MTISRRALLAGVPVAAALAGLVGYRRNADRTLINVRWFGARGDGLTDDSCAIQAAAATLQSGETLYFPSGTYRFAQRRPPSGAAITISDAATDGARTRTKAPRSRKRPGARHRPSAMQPQRAPGAL